MPGDVPAVDAAVRILEMLAGEWPASVSPGRLVAHLELNRSTCYNILGTLQSMGWATNLGDRAGWTLGPRLLSLTGVNRTLSAALVQDVIDDLSRELGLVVFAAERDGAGGYIVTAKAERRSGVRVTVGVGDRFPFSAPALMQAFEAWSSPEELQRLLDVHHLEQFTEHTVTSHEDLRRVLLRVRATGYSHSLRQFDLAQGAAASPIFDARGRVNLVLCTLAFASDLNEGTVARIGEAVRRAAEQVTQRLGGRTPDRVDEGSESVLA